MHKPVPKIVCERFKLGETFRVEVFYPHLPPICSLCNEVGHPSKRCLKAPLHCNKCRNAFYEEALCPLTNKFKKVVKNTLVQVEMRKSEASSILKCAEPSSSNVNQSPDTSSGLAEVRNEANNLDLKLDSNPKCRSLLSCQ